MVYVRPAVAMVAVPVNSQRDRSGCAEVPVRLLLHQA
jgi:hypothetical protein